MQNAEIDYARVLSLAAPSHILVATDLEDTESLLPHIITQARENRARVTLLHVVPLAAEVNMEAWAMPSVLEVNQNNLHHAEIVLYGYLQRLQAAGIDATRIVRYGDPVPVICEELERTGAQRLIVGTHGRGRIGQMLIGSVAGKLLYASPVPVFSVNPITRQETASDVKAYTTPRHILHPVSLRDDYHASAQLAIAIAARHQAELTLLHVLDRADTRGKKTDDIAAENFKVREKLVALCQYAALPPENIYIRILVGNPVEEILAASEWSGSDWLILGIYRNSPGLLHGHNLPDRILAGSHCPVLSLHTEHRQPQEAHDPILPTATIQPHLLF